MNRGLSLAGTNELSVAVLYELKFVVLGQAWQCSMNRGLPSAGKRGRGLSLAGRNESRQEIPGSELVEMLDPGSEGIKENK